MSYRDDVDALVARHRALTDEVETTTRERDKAKRLLDEAIAGRKAQTLLKLRIASPCKANWSDMVGDDRVRLCGDCDRNVFNVSTMTADEAEHLIHNHTGRLCVRYFQRADGTILLADCEIGSRPKRRRRMIAGGAAALLAGYGLATALMREQAIKDSEELALPYAGGAGDLPMAVSGETATPALDDSNE